MQVATGQATFTTLILLLINGVLFAASWIVTMRFTGDISFFGNIDGEVLFQMGGKHRVMILAGGEWWRLVTAGFLHGGILHLLFNSMSLFNLGPLAEQIFGAHRFLVLYLATGVAGFAASTFWSPYLSIGASASICGLIGACYAYGRINSNSQLRSIAVRWIIGIGIFGLLFPNIDNAAHFGGLACGFGFAYATSSPGHDQARESMWKGTSTAAALLAAAAFYMAYRNFVAHTS